MNATIGDIPMFNETPIVMEFYNSILIQIYIYFTELFLLFKKY